MINTGPYIENSCGMPLKLVANYHLGRERESLGFRHVLESLGNIDSISSTLSFNFPLEALMVIVFKALASFRIYIINSTSCYNPSNPLKLKFVRCDER